MLEVVGGGNVFGGEAAGVRGVGRDGLDVHAGKLLRGRRADAGQ